MFITALFTIAKTQKQSKYPMADEWVKKICMCVYMCVCVCVCLTMKLGKAKEDLFISKSTEIEN